MNIASIAIILLIIFSITWFALRSRINTLRNQQLTGLVQIETLKSLITLLQKHRGLSATQGEQDATVKAGLRDLKNKIQQQSTRLNISMVEQDRWISFVDHWKRLSTEQQRHNVENSFSQHTNMIANLIYLLEDVAEQNALNMNELPDFKHISLIWCELVNVIESVGQSRAVGSASVSAGRCTSVEIIRLKFLIKHITEQSSKVVSQLTATNNAPKGLLLECQQQIDLLIKTISEEVIGTKTIKISRAEYFDLATGVIDLLNQVFDNQVWLLKASLGEK